MINQSQRAKLHAICLVKNEDDIIVQTLNHARRYCDRIFVFDNGSVDRTWEYVQELAKADSGIVPFGQTLEPYARNLRAAIYYEVGPQLSEEDWWLILDADEFLAEDPQPIMRQAIREGADVIRSWQIDFLYTDVDLRAWEEGKDSRSQPIMERRLFYLIRTQERRLFRNRRQLSWPSGNVPEGLGKACRRLVMNRHYRFRDPPQIQKRLQQRPLRSYYKGNYNPGWRILVKNSRELDFHEKGEPWRFRLLRVSRYYRKRFFRRAGKQWDLLLNLIGTRSDALVKSQKRRKPAS